MGDNRGFWKLPTRHENKNETASPSNSEPLIIVTGRSVKSIQMGMLDMLSMVKILERENIVCGRVTRQKTWKTLFCRFVDKLVPHSTNLS